MPTVTQIVTQIRPISQYLASNDISKGALFGAKNNPLLANELYIVGKSVKYRYDYEGIAGGATPSASLVQSSNYLYQLCDKYGLAAIFLIGTGGQLPGTGTITTIYGLPVFGYYIGVFDGETSITLNLPTGARIITVSKSIDTLIPSQYSWVQPTLTLLNGVSMTQGEELTYLYAVPI